LNGDLPLNRRPPARAVDQEGKGILAIMVLAEPWQEGDLKKYRTAQSAEENRKYSAKIEA